MVLRRASLHVWVVASETYADMAAGSVEGRWLLGAQDGECAGVLAWFVEDGHACALRGVGVLDQVLRVHSMDDLALAPWDLSAVGGAGRQRGPGERSNNTEISEYLFIFYSDNPLV